VTANPRVSVRVRVHADTIVTVIDLSPQGLQEWVQIGETNDVNLFVGSPAKAREIAQKFTELAGLLEAREREAAPANRTGETGGA
jgi:hypothetical protein